VIKEKPSIIVRSIDVPYLIEVENILLNCVGPVVIGKTFFSFINIFIFEEVIYAP